MRGVEIKLLKLLKRIFPSEYLSWRAVWCGLLGHFYPKFAFIVIYVSVGLVTAYL